jgi:universal stress protein A
MKTVLAPIDFSTASDRVIERALLLARSTGARLVLLHIVVPPPLVARRLAQSAGGSELIQDAVEAAAEELRKIQRRLRDRGVTAHAVHATGEARTCIVEQAERLGADYIVIGSHGHTAFYDLLVGSTASAVLKRAACPVVVVPPGTAAWRQPAGGTAATHALEV